MIAIKNILVATDFGPASEHGASGTGGPWPRRSARGCTAPRRRRASTSRPRRLRLREHFAGLQRGDRGGGAEADRGGC